MGGEQAEARRSLFLKDTWWLECLDGQPRTDVDRPPGAVRWL